MPPAPPAEFAIVPPSALYTAACVLVPALIGAVMYPLFSVWERARRRRARGEEITWVDYQI